MAALDADELTADELTAAMETPRDVTAADVSGELTVQSAPDSGPSLQVRSRSDIATGRLLTSP